MKGAAPLDWSCVSFPEASALNSLRFQEKKAAGDFGEPTGERSALARALFEQSATQFSEGMAPWTLLTRYRSFRVFISHADEGRQAVSLSTISQRFTEWARHLEERVARREIGKHTQYGLVTRVAKQIADVLECPLAEVMVGVRLKKPKRASKRSRDKQNLEVTQQFVSDVLDVVQSISVEKLRAGGSIELTVDGTSIGRVGSPTRTRTNVSRCRQPALNMRMAAEFSLFIAATAMNRADATSLEHSDFRYQSFEDRIEVTALKGRAEKVVRFSIIPGYRPHFDAFLKFRNEFYADVATDKLFVTLSSGLRANDKMVNTQPLASIFGRSGRHWVPPTILRKTKANVIARFASVNDAARALQNTESVLDRHYLYPAHQQAVIEMGAYFRDLEKVGEVRAATGPGACEAEVGEVSKRVTGMLPAPDCRSPAGCLFCAYNHGQRSLDYVWNLLSFRELKQTEIARYRHRAGPPLKGALARTLARMEEIITSMDGDAELEGWRNDARLLISAGEHHPRWAHWIALAGI